MAPPVASQTGRGRSSIDGIEIKRVTGKGPAPLPVTQKDAPQTLYWIGTTHWSGNRLCFPFFWRSNPSSGQ